MTARRQNQPQIDAMTPAIAGLQGHGTAHNRPADIAIGRASSDDVRTFLTIIRAILFTKGIPQGFTFDTTFGGERSCELFRGIDFLRTGSGPAANHTILGGCGGAV